MTSSTVSTSATPARGGWITAAIVGVLILVGWIAILALYKLKPTVGTLFLGLGWTSIIAFGLLATRAVQAVVGGAAVMEEDGRDDRRRMELEREKRLLLKAIKEVEFDRDTGKLDEADAKVSIDRYRERALEIIATLDDRDRPIAARIDEELKKRLAKIEKTEAKKEKAGEKKPGTCEGCGLENDADATFCKRCGKKVAA